MKTFSKLSFAIIALLSFQLRAQNEMTKDTGAYDAIHISGPFEVTLTKGQEGSISFEGDEKELEKVTYKIKNNALYIGLEKTRFWGSWNSIKGKIYVEIPVQDINELNIDPITRWRIGWSDYKPPMTDFFVPISYPQSTAEK